MKKSLKITGCLLATVALSACSCNSKLTDIKLEDINQTATVFLNSLDPNYEGYPKDFPINYSIHLENNQGLGENLKDKSVTLNSLDFAKESNGEFSLKYKGTNYIEHEYIFYNEGDTWLMFKSKTKNDGSLEKTYNKMSYLEYRNYLDADTLLANLEESITSVLKDILNASNYQMYKLPENKNKKETVVNDVTYFNTSSFTKDKNNVMSATLSTTTRQEAVGKDETVVTSKKFYEGRFNWQFHKNRLINASWNKAEGPLDGEKALTNGSVNLTYGTTNIAKPNVKDYKLVA